MIEMALIAPVMFLLIFGIIEFGVMMFDVSAARFAAGEAAKVEAQVGAGNTDCPTLTQLQCAETFPNLADCGSQGAPKNCKCDADCQAVLSINQTALGSTSLVQVDGIDVIKLKSDGSFQPIGYPGVPTTLNSYVLRPISWVKGTTYDPNNRNVQLGNSDYLAVTIRFTYKWKTGLFQSFPNPQMTSSYYVRLEPQKF